MKEERQWKMSDEGRRNISKARTGIKLSEETKHKISLAKQGVNSYNWKGDKVKYRSLHTWVGRHKGGAKECEFCGKEKTTVKSIHWANKSHLYKRDLNDWIALCTFCHKKYDKK